MDDEKLKKAIKTSQKLKEGEGVLNSLLLADGIEFSASKYRGRRISNSLAYLNNDNLFIVAKTFIRIELEMRIDKLKKEFEEM